jgi:hypothetical protein
MATKKFSLGRLQLGDRLNFQGDGSEFLAHALVIEPRRHPVCTLIEYVSDDISTIQLLGTIDWRTGVGHMLNQFLDGKLVAGIGQLLYLELNSSKPVSRPFDDFSI